MKRKLAFLLAFMLLLSTAGFALAAYTPVTTGLNMSVGTRSGPGTNYNELGTYFPDTWYNTTVKAYSKCRNNNVWWVQVEFTYRGMQYRAYTGEQRLKIGASQLPEEHQIGTGRITSAGRAYTGPGTNYQQTTYTVPNGISVNVFDTENGYAQVEYYDGNTRYNRRFWVSMDSVSISYNGYYNPTPTPTPYTPTPTPTPYTNPYDDWTQYDDWTHYEGNAMFSEGDVFIWNGSDDTGFTVTSGADGNGIATIELTILGEITYHRLYLYMDSSSQGSFFTLDGREGVLYFYDGYCILRMDLNYAGIGNELVMMKY